MEHYNQRAQEIYDLVEVATSHEKTLMVEELCDLLSSMDFKYTNLLLKTKDQDQRAQELYDQDSRILSPFNLLLKTKN